VPETRNGFEQNAASASLAHLTGAACQSHALGSAGVADMHSALDTA
jgi:hypothetical protein